jgi:hypothetical protein
LGNGQVISPLPADVFTHNLKATSASQPIAPWLLLIAALLLPFDIAVRRLIITKHDGGLMREWISQRLPSRAASPTYKAEANPRMEALRNAKSRVRESKNGSAGEMPIETESTSSVEKEAKADSSQATRCVRRLDHIRIIGAEKNIQK